MTPIRFFALLALSAALPQTLSAQSAWTRLSPATAPSLRGGISGSTDGSQFLMFGGQTVGTTFLNDLWSFDGTSWTDLTPATGNPPGRDWHGQAFDSARGKLVVFGGRDGATTFSDTWEWDGTSWSQVTTAKAPSPSSTRVSTFGLSVRFSRRPGGTNNSSPDDSMG